MTINDITAPTELSQEQQKEKCLRQQLFKLVGEKHLKLSSLLDDAPSFVKEQCIDHCGKSRTPTLRDVAEVMGLDFVLSTDENGENIYHHIARADYPFGIEVLMGLENRTEIGHDSSLSTNERIAKIHAAMARINNSGAAPIDIASPPSKTHTLFKIALGKEEEEEKKQSSTVRRTPGKGSR